MRTLRVLLVVAVVVLGLALTGTGRATVPRTGPEDTAAARAVAALTGPARADAPIPADFPAVAGYRPEHRAAPDGGLLLVSPGGDCSAPAAFGAVFADACAAHDLGYDLLRYADRRAGPLGPWARQALDRRLAADLSARCEDSPTAPRWCHLQAGLAAVVVGANSWRQGDGVAVVEEPSRFAGGALVVGGGLQVLALLTRRASR